MLLKKLYKTFSSISDCNRNTKPVRSITLQPDEGRKSEYNSTITGQGSDKGFSHSPLNTRSHLLKILEAALFCQFQGNRFFPPLTDSDPVVPSDWILDDLSLIGLSHFKSRFEGPVSKTKIQKKKHLVFIPLQKIHDSPLQILFSIRYYCHHMKYPRIR